jgi:hypothetical protein
VINTISDDTTIWVIETRVLEPRVIPIEGNANNEIPSISILEVPVELNPVVTPATEEIHQIPALPREDQFSVRWSQRLCPREAAAILLSKTKIDKAQAEIRRQLVLRKDWIDKEFAFKISVNAALREHGEEAREVIMKGLRQLVDKKVWYEVKLTNLSQVQRKAIIRSSMFLKDKYIASGAF